MEKRKKKKSVIVPMSEIIHETRSRKKDGTFPVKLRVYYNREYRYFSTGIDISIDDFNQIMFGQRKTKEQRVIEIKLSAFKTKADDIIEKMPLFDFDAFEKAYLDRRDLVESVSFAFDNLIVDLKADGRIGTATSYNGAKRSLESFKKNLTFGDITKRFLQSYESWMIKNGNSITSVGIHLRALRRVYNLQNINPKIYPFGSGDKQYIIPSGQNIKKSLTMNQISMIYNYNATGLEAKARDYWMFMYLANGMNVADLCCLKWKDIDEDYITFIREKTRRNVKNITKIRVFYRPEMKEIIDRWGVVSISKENYIFPHFNVSMNEERKYTIRRNLTSEINKQMKKIAKSIGLKSSLSTIHARHSFSTILKRSGESVEKISEMLGHTKIETTQNYLGSFEDDQIKEASQSLVAGLTKAK